MTRRVIDPLVQRLDIIRAQRGMTLSAWADTAGVARATVYRGLGGATSLATVRALAEALGMELSVNTTGGNLNNIKGEAVVVACGEATT